MNQREVRDTIKKRMGMTGIEAEALMAEMLGLSESTTHSLCCDDSRIMPFHWQLVFEQYGFRFPTDGAVNVVRIKDDPIIPNDEHRRRARIQRLACDALQNRSIRFIGNPKPLLDCLFGEKRAVIDLGYGITSEPVTQKEIGERLLKDVKQIPNIKLHALWNICAKNFTYITDLSETGY